MAEVHVLPGIERRDLAGEPVPSHEVLRAALDKGITDVIVVGRQRDGTPYVASAGNDVDRDVGMLMRAVSFLSSAELVPSKVDTDPPVAG